MADTQKPFDPDAFMASRAGGSHASFDPDAFMASRESAEPVRGAEKLGGRPPAASPAVVPPALQGPPVEHKGFLESVGDALAGWPAGAWHALTSSPMSEAAEDIRKLPRASEVQSRYRPPLDSTSEAMLGPGLSEDYGPTLSEIAGHMIGEQIPNAAVAALLGSADSPKVRSFVSGAAKAGVNRIVPASVAGFAMNRMLPHWATATGEALLTFPQMIHGGMEAANGKPWVGPVGNAVADVLMPPKPDVRGLLEAPADTSFVRGQNARFGEQPLLEAPSIKASPVQDTSYIRGVPAMTQPPNPGRALGPASVIPMPAAPDTSFVRGVPAEYGHRVIPQGGTVLPAGPVENAIGPIEVLPSSAESNVVPIPATDYSSITSQYKPSRSKARFDPSGRRLDSNGKPMF